MTFNINSIKTEETKTIFISIYELAGKIEITFSKENDKASFLLNEIDEFKFDKTIKGFRFPFNKKSSETIQSGIRKLMLNINDFDKNYKLETIKVKEEEVELDLFGGFDIPEEVKKEKKEKKPSQPKNKFSDFDDEDLEETLDAAQNAYSHKMQRIAKSKNSRLQTLEEQDKTFNESIESRMMEALKPFYVVDNNGKILRFKDFNYNTYSLISEKECVEFIISKIKEFGYSNFDNAGAAERIYKYINIFSGSNSKIVRTLSEKHFSVLIEDDNGNAENVMFFIDFDRVLNRSYVKVIDPKSVNNAKYRLKNIRMKIENLIDREGNNLTSVNQIDFENNGFYKYIPKFNKKSELNKYLFNVMYTNEEHKQAAQIVEGSFFTDKNLQLSLNNCGEGGNGKSVKSTIDEFAYEGLTFLNANVSMKDAEGFNNYEGYNYPRWIIPEFSGSYNVDYFKRLVGRDTISFKKKNVNEVVPYKFNKMVLIINTNYNKLPIISNDDVAMIRRMIFVKTEAPSDKQKIDGLDQYLLHGGHCYNENYEEEHLYFDGNAHNDLFEWHLEGAIKLENMGSFSIEKLGQSVVDFKKEMIERMSNGANFFGYFGMVESEDNGILLEELLEEFKKFKGNENYNKKKFAEELKRQYKIEFKKEIRIEDVYVKYTNINGEDCKIKRTIYFVDFTGFKGVLTKFNKNQIINVDKPHKDNGVISLVIKDYEEKNKDKEVSRIGQRKKAIINK